MGSMDCKLSAFHWVVEKLVHIFGTGVELFSFPSMQQTPETINFE
jgi:hypothetical protein